MLGQLMIKGIGSLMEDISKDAIVELLFVIGVFWLLDTGNIAVVELQWAAHVFVDGRRRKRVIVCFQLCVER